MSSPAAGARASKVRWGPIGLGVAGVAAVAIAAAGYFVFGRNPVVAALPSSATEIADARESYPGLEGDYVYCLCARVAADALAPLARDLHLAPASSFPDPPSPTMHVGFDCPSTRRPPCWREPPPLSDAWLKIDRGFVEIAGWRDGVLYYSSSHQ